MRTLIYFTRELPGMTEDLERAGFQVYEALAISEVFYLAERILQRTSSLIPRWRMRQQARLLYIIPH